MSHQNQFKIFSKTIWLLTFLYVNSVPRSVWAQEPIQVESNRCDYVFGQQIRFSLQVSSDAPIQSVVLAFRTQDTRGTTVQTMAFEPNTALQLEYVHSISERYIQPFVQVRYWWTIENVRQEKYVTEPQTLFYDDNRFAWQTQENDIARIHWYQGQMETAVRALDVVAEGIERAQQDIPASTLSQPLEIYMYASPDDMQMTLPGLLSRREQAVTLYETRIILVSFAPYPNQWVEIQRVLPHEATHVLIHQVTQSYFDRVPLWLAEGLATWVQQAFVPEPEHQQMLQEALRQNDLIPLNTLCASFPADPTRARLAYAQSASVVNFIRDAYGRQALRDLVTAFADGATCEGGVQRVLSVSLDRLQRQWRDSLLPRSPWSVFWQENGAWLILLALMTGLPLLFIYTPRQRM